MPFEDSKEKAAAQQSLFGAIELMTKEVVDSSSNRGQKCEMLRDLAMAYRYAAGGPQPGGTAAIVK